MNIQEILKSHVKSCSFNIIKVSSVILRDKFSQSSIEFYPVLVNLSLRETIRVKNSLIHIDLKLFAFLNHSQLIRFEIEFPRVFTGTTKVSLWFT